METPISILSSYELANDENLSWMNKRLSYNEMECEPDLQSTQQAPMDNSRGMQASYYDKPATNKCETQEEHLDTTKDLRNDASLLIEQNQGFNSFISSQKTEREIQ